jgi:hypothetical protein
LLRNELVVQADESRMAIPLVNPLYRRKMAGQVDTCSDFILRRRLKH